MSGITQVRQHVALEKTYAPPPPKDGGRLSGHDVATEGGASAKANHTKTQWERFKSRASQSLSRFKDCFTSDDTTSDRRAARFNQRHEVFSLRVKNLIGDLASGKAGGLSDPDLLATLRNDVKHLHNDAPWASRPNLLEARMDVELAGLSDDQLRDISNAIKDADRSNLTDKDKADLDTMQRTVLKHQLARSTEVTEILGAINKGSPEDVSGKATLNTKVNVAKGKISMDLTAKGLTYPSGDEGTLQKRTDQLNILSGAIRLRLQSDRVSPGDLGAMNRNLLNIERQYNKDNQDSHYGEISRNLPYLRAATRAVRQEFLKTKVTDFNDDNLKTRMKVLGAGAAHEVCKGSYEVGGQTVSKVHKYDDEQLTLPGQGRFTAPLELGIDQTNPRLLERAVITSEINKKLGFDVCVGTDLAMHHGEVGIVMDLAKGATAHDTWGIDHSSGALLREMTKLQVLDIITGQGDRHGGNYMIDRGENGTVNGLKAIDSDFALGPKGSDVNNLVGKDGVHLRGLPPVVDTEMRDKILSLTEHDLDQITENMLDDESVQSAKDRLAQLKAHIQSPQCTVISPDDWGKKEVMDQFNEKNSYWGRDKAGFDMPKF